MGGASEAASGQAEDPRMGWGRSQETHIPTAHGRTVGLPETKMEAAILKKLKNELQV